MDARRVSAAGSRRHVALGGQRWRGALLRQGELPDRREARGPRGRRRAADEEGPRRPAHHRAAAVEHRPAVPALPPDGRQAPDGAVQEEEPKGGQPGSTGHGYANATTASFIGEPARAEAGTLPTQLDFTGC